MLLEHCAQARFVWNLAVEQQGWWRPGRKSAPGFTERCRQLTEARAEFGWLAAGSVTVQQQALKDHAMAMANFFAGTHRRPTWRKAGRDEGFRIVGVRGKAWDVRRVSRNAGQVWVPKVGWVAFRWSRTVPAEAKSFRVVRDAAGRWFVAFAVIPTPVPAPGNDVVVGVDRGVVVSAALSTGDLLTVPGLSERERSRLVRLQRKLAKAKRGSKRRAKVKAQIGRLKVRETDRRKDFVEKVSTKLACGFDVIAFEDLNIAGMTRSAKGTLNEPGSNVAQKRGLNRGIMAAGWGELVRRTTGKAPGRVMLVNPAYTSQRCSACGHVAKDNRE
ncbi:MAG: (cytosine-5-)-methyltransferase, partial [Actinomycetia bacterium]|nr:(cytosine-5-)-methyltransferase [Actinomycetes bacterium]